MTSLVTRIEEIYWAEGFKISVFDEFEEEVPSGTHGVLPRYDYKQMLTGSKTVGDWKRLRFAPNDPDYTCKVLCADGTPVRDHAELDFVRQSYA